MGTIFFQQAFGNETAPRVMAGIVAFSIQGSIFVMTFTACRVKQEIAKEGILPFFLFFSKSNITSYARLKARFFPDSEDEDEVPEQSPIPALFLHWAFSVILIAATSSRPPRVAYTILIELYGYTTILMVGFFVSVGLIYLRTFKSKEWMPSIGFRPWGGPTAAIIYGCVPFPFSPFPFSSSIRFPFPFPLCSFPFSFQSPLLNRLPSSLSHQPSSTSPHTSHPTPTLTQKTYRLSRTICAFLLLTLFLNPSHASSFSPTRTGISAYVVPTVGLGSLVVGHCYYLVFAKLIPRWRRKELIVEREPIIVRQGGKADGQWVQLMEVVEFWWAARSPKSEM